MNWASDELLRLLKENWQLAASIVAGIACLGIIFGALKRAASILLTSGLNAGDVVVTRIVAKPKGIILLMAVAGLIVPSAFGGYFLSQPKIVTKVETRTVYQVDDAGVNRLQRERDAALTAKQEVDAAKRGVEGDLAALQTRFDSLEQDNNSVNQQLRTLGDRYQRLNPDAAEVARLETLLNKEHEIDVVHHHIYQSYRPSRFIPHDNIKEESDLSNAYTSRTHKGPGGSSGARVSYHTNCGDCGKNLKLHQAIDAIFEKHPNWRPGRLED